MLICEESNNRQNSIESMKETKKLAFEVIDLGFILTIYRGGILN